MIIFTLVTETDTSTDASTDTDVSMNVRKLLKMITSLV